MVPCQDTPAVKAPFSATVTVPAPLTVVMSANQHRQVQAGEQFNVYKFSQTIPIPVRKNRGHTHFNSYVLLHHSPT